MRTATRVQNGPHVSIVRLPKLHDAQKEIKRAACRFNVIRCGRRFGKNVLLQDLIITRAIEGYPVSWFSPTYKMLRLDWETITKAVAPITADKSAQEKRIRLITGGEIDFWSLEAPDTIRGRKYALGAINEAAFVPNLFSIWGEIIRPMLADLKGGMWFSSTPKGLNDFWKVWEYARGEDWARWHKTTYDNPFIDSAEIDTMKASMPERTFLQEIMAEFIEDGAGVFRRVHQAAIAEPQERAISGHEYVIGVDWARTDDATVYVVVDTTIRAAVCIDRMNNTDYATQRNRLQSLALRFGPRQILVESNSMGGAQLEALQSMGLYVTGFNTSNESKQQIIDALALAFEQGTLTIVPDDTMVNELQAYQSERLPSGRVSFGAPSGMHDDTVMALALAWWASGGGASWYMF